MAKLTQENLLSIFREVKDQMKSYERGTVKARFDIEGKYDLWSEKDLVDPLGKKRREIGFAALIVQNNYVGFYFMPIYCIEKMRNLIHPDLMKLLKGKACFHIKDTSPQMLGHI